MKIIGRIEEVKFNGRNPFVALTCGEEGRGRKLGFIDCVESLMDKIETETEKRINRRYRRRNSNRKTFFKRSR